MDEEVKKITYQPNNSKGGKLKFLIVFLLICFVGALVLYSFQENYVEDVVKNISKPKINTSSEEAYFKSIEEINKTLNTTERQIFDETLLYVVYCCLPAR